MLVSIIKYITGIAFLGSAMSLTVNAYYSAPIVIWCSLIFSLIIAVHLRFINSSVKTSSSISWLDTLYIFIVIYLLTAVISSVTIYTILT